MARTIGEICETQSAFLSSRFEWRVPDILSVLQQYDDACQSPTFAFCDGDWTLTMIRSAQTKMIQCLCIRINRRAKISSHKNHVEYKLIKINIDEAEHLLTEYNAEADKSIWNDLVLFDLHGQNFSWSDESAFDLKLVCTLKCFDCKPFKQAASQEALSKSFDRLGTDFLNLLTGGEDSDVTIKVKNRVFRAHRNIIRARSSVFYAMFRHDIVERKKGVNITDCEPEAFEKFLEYLYSGRMKICSMAIADTLYYIADKYHILDVKAQCMRFMSENLSVETFCDIVTLSLRHKELELLRSADRYFVNNSKAIMETGRWLTFVKENPATPNDCFIKLAPEIYRVCGGPVAKASGCQPGEPGSNLDSRHEDHRVYKGDRHVKSVGLKVFSWRCWQGRRGKSISNTLLFRLGLNWKARNVLLAQHDQIRPLRRKNLQIQSSPEADHKKKKNPEFFRGTDETWEQSNKERLV